MTIGHFLGEIKAGRGMAAVERESNRLGMRKIVRGARLGLKAASQILPGKYGEMAGAANTALDNAFCCQSHERKDLLLIGTVRTKFNSTVCFKHNIIFIVPSTV